MKPLSLRTPSTALVSLLVLSLVCWSLGLSFWFGTAEAAGLGSISDTLAPTSAPGLDAAHRIKFTTPNGLVEDEVMRISFDPSTTAFDLTGLAGADISIPQGAELVAGCTGTPSEVLVSINPETIDFTVCTSDSIASSTTFVIDVGTTTGGNLINNPATAGSYVINIEGVGATPFVDEGDTRVVIIDDVTATAAVDTVFNFSINAVGPGVSVNDDVKLTAASSTATTVPFGILVPDDATLMAQRLLVETNALNGFSVTVQADTTLIAGNGATIDEFIDNAATASTTLWQGPTSIMGSPDTYGHWGVTSDDNVVSSTTPNKWGAGYASYQGNFTGNNPVEVFYHNAAVTSTAGMGVGSTTVAYKVEITELQEAAKDYTATLTYIATPVF